MDAINELDKQILLKSSSIAGLVIGILSLIPLINCLNYLACFWVWVGAILAIFLYKQWSELTAPITQLQGAVIGGCSAMAGLVVYFGILFGLTALFSVLGAIAGVNHEEIMANIILSGVSSIIMIPLSIVFASVSGVLAGAIGSVLLEKL